MPTMVMKQATIGTIPRLVVALLLQSLAFLPIASGTGFEYRNDATCSDGATVSVSSIKCDGGSVCNFDGSLEAYGTITLQHDVSEYVCMSMKNCFMGVAFMCRYVEDELIDVCSGMNLQPMGSYSCPSQGEYSFSAQFDIPSGDGIHMGGGWWVTSYVTFRDCTSRKVQAKCQASFVAVSENGSSASLIGFSAIGLVALGYFVARKRRTARINLLQEEAIASDANQHSSMVTGHFEMMKDTGVRV